MTFLRRLAAVLLVVAAVVALGVAWEHSSEAGWITPQGAGHGGTKMVAHGAPAHPPPGTVTPQGGGRVVQSPQGGGRVIRSNPGSGMGIDLSNLGNLSSTAEIEVAVAAGVVLLDIIRRRQRRARRTSR